MTDPVSSQQESVSATSTVTVVTTEAQVIIKKKNY